MEIDSDLMRKFPDIAVTELEISDVFVAQNPDIEKLKKETADEIKRKYNLDSLRDFPALRAYRDFFWHIGIDPTKERPSAEALIRRVLLGKEVPIINNVVDCYNIASMKTCICIGAFDKDKICGKMLLRFALPGEKFLGIGMKEMIVLRSNEIVISDEEKIIAIYPYRDAENTKITENTRNIVLVFCGAPGIRIEMLMLAEKAAAEYITRYCCTKRKL